MKPTLKQTITIHNDDDFDFALFRTIYRDDGTSTKSSVSFDGGLIYRILVRRYGSWSWLTYAPTLELMYNDLVEQFKDFISTNKYNFERIFSAYETEFNPAWNYDKYSTITSEYGRVHSTMDSGQRVTHTPQTKTTTTDTESPNTSNDFLNSIKSETVTDAFNTQIDEAVDESTTDARTDKVVDRTFGNIGVMTSTQAITEVEELYIKAFIYTLIEEFCNECLYL